MIKHGKVFPLNGNGASHFAPIKDFITKGIADAREKIVLHPQACDVKGAKRHNGQQCVIARALKRKYKPQAVAVGRSLAYVVFGGLAIRFTMPPASRKMVEEFDQRGRARSAPVELCAVSKSWQLRKPQAKDTRKKREYPADTVRTRAKKYGVRAIGGGIA